MVKKIALLILLVSSPSWAVMEYYNLSRSIRALGMGGAFYGLSDDEYALFYNPAGLSLYRGRGELMLSVEAQSATETFAALKTLGSLSGSSNTDLINKLSQYQGQDIFAGVNVFPFYIRKHFAVGLLLADTKVNLGLLGSNLDSSVDATVISDSGLLIGYGRQMFDENLHIGLTSKALVRAGGKKELAILDLAQGSSLNLDPQSLGGVGFGIDFDLGAIYELPVPLFGLSNRLALSFNNLLASNFSLANFAGGSVPQLPRMLSLGSSANLAGHGWIDNFILGFDLAEFGMGGQGDPDYGARVGSFWKHVNLGVEMPMGGGWFTLRAGIHEGDFSAGLGINGKYAKLEIATYTEQLFQGLDRFSSRRWMLRLSIGAGEINRPITKGTEMNRLPVVVERVAETPERGSAPALDKKFDLVPTGSPESSIGE